MFEFINNTYSTMAFTAEKNDLVREALSENLSAYDHHDIYEYIWLDGKILQKDDPEAKISPLTHSLQYSGAPFEGVRIYEGNILLSTEHAARLLDGVRQHDFSIPYSVQDIVHACRDVCAKNNLKNGYIRPCAYRGSEDIRVAGPNAKAHLVVIALPLPSVFNGDQSLMTVTMRRSGQCFKAQTKSSEVFAAALLSKNEAERKGFKDALFLSIDGYVADSTAANVFFLIDGEWVTPSFEDILKGITLQVVFKLLEKRGITVKVRQIKPEELARATEGFLCGTAAEVNGISRVDDVVLPRGETTTTLIADYFELVKKSDPVVRQELGLAIGEILFE